MGVVDLAPSFRAAIVTDDRSCFEAFQREFGYLCRTLRRLGVGPDDLEDDVHEVFLVLNRKWADYDASRPLKPWLFGFAFRIASHYRRRARREIACLDADTLSHGGEGPDSLLDKERKRKLVLDALDGIELSRRAVFVLHELDGVTCERIAQTLEIPVGTVYSRLRLARADFASAVRRLQARRAVGCAC